MSNYSQSNLVSGLDDQGNPRTIKVSNDGTVQTSTVDFGTKITDSTMPTGGVGNLGWLSAIWKQLIDKLPALVGGKIPVDVASLNVTFDNANLEISNDVGNPVPISDAGGSITVDGSVSISNFPATQTISGTATITRAANITAYTANDVYGGVFELQNIGSSGGFVFISSIDIIFNITALPSGMGAFALYLYSSSPPSAITDNLPFSLSSDDRASSLTPGGIILTASLARGGGSVVAEALNLNRLIKLANTSIWGYLVTLAAFTPVANSETATITVEAFAP